MSLCRLCPNVVVVQYKTYLNYVLYRIGICKKKTLIFYLKVHSTSIIRKCNSQIMSQGHGNHFGK